MNLTPFLFFAYPNYFSRDDVHAAEKLGIPSYIGDYTTHSIRMYDPRTMGPISQRNFGGGFSLMGMSPGVPYMFRLLSSLILVLAILLSKTACAAQAENCGPNIISNTPECISKAVFEGHDREMPEGLVYDLAIDPVFDKAGRPVIPGTIQDAFRLMRQMLPHWYLNALQRSRGDNECDVIVNGYSYATDIMAWTRTNWRLNSDDSALRNYLFRMGFRYNDEIDQALSYGFCIYIKSGNDDEKGIEAIQEVKRK